MLISRLPPVSADPCWREREVGSCIQGGGSAGGLLLDPGQQGWRIPGARAHRVLSELTELCESSDSAVRAHGMVLDALAAAGSSLKPHNDHVWLPEEQQIVI